MIGAPRRGNEVAGRFLAGRPFASPIGLSVLVPGWPHIAWGQHERGSVLFGSFVAAVIAGLWTWGTWIGWCFLGYAFVLHVASACDALRQGSFPVYPGRTALVFVTGSFALLFYIPTLFALLLFAWPGFQPTGSDVGFLVNRCAYRAAAPAQGQWIWMRPPTIGVPRAALVLAVAGEEVEWTGQAWKINGKYRVLHSPARLKAWPQTCRFTVPANQILVEPDDDGVSTPPLGPVVLVSRSSVLGRAWAQFYPVVDRHLL
jgi:hypothetical protein